MMRCFLPSMIMISPEIKFICRNVYVMLLIVLTLILIGMVINIMLPINIKCNWSCYVVNKIFWKTILKLHLAKEKLWLQVNDGN